MKKSESPTWSRDPPSSALGPLDQDRIAFGDEAFPVEIGGFIRRPQAKAVQMKHRPSPSVIPMNQRIRWTRRRRVNAEPSGHSFDEGRFSCSQLPLESEQLTRAKSSAQLLSPGIQLIERE
jgi:hypothetical protein